MRRRLFPFLAFGIACALVVTGCGGQRRPFRSAVVVPQADAPFDAIWAYAGSLEAQIKPYARRRFRNFPEGLRKAVSQHRVEFLASGRLAGTVPDLQSFLFFEYRRQRGLAGNDKPGAPDATTARYVRALVNAIGQHPRQAP